MSDRPMTATEVRQRSVEAAFEKAYEPERRALHNRFIRYVQDGMDASLFRQGKQLMLALDMGDLGEHHPWRHVHLQMLEELP